jgi:type VI secretion system protein ImpL
MEKIIKFIQQTWFLSLLGIIAISFIIYFFGDLLKIASFHPFLDLQNRYIAIGILISTWVFYQLWSWFQTRRKNKQMLESLVESTKISPAEQASEEEIQILSENLQNALQRLKKTQAKDGSKQDIYQLPWYMVIGPPGAGKTTLLSNSKLHFPLSEKHGKNAFRGVGGTRNCDWWFTDEAILLDTAGRYTTQDSDKHIDQTAWKGFLQLLRKNRQHQPINGIIIAVSLSDVLQFSADDLEKHAVTIRQRIQELQTHLEIAFPVYMVFTKCDLLSGFAEFFDGLDTKGRDQVWGVTFPYKDNTKTNLITTFSSEFTLLEEQIYRKLIDKLDNERSLQRRQALYLFPQQFSALKTSLITFLEHIYQASRFHETVMLRGVYFTSATQEGTPIDRIMSSLISNYGVSPQQQSRFLDKGKSFFINHVLKQVIFPESGLAGNNLKLKQKMQWLRRLMILTVLCFSIAISSLLLISYFNNKVYLTEYQNKINLIEKKINKIPKETNDLEPYLVILGELRQLSYSYADIPIDTPLMSHFGFGLSQAESLGKQVNSKYEDLLIKTLRPYAKSMLEKNIQQNIVDNPENIFGALKSYLFLGGESPKEKSIAVQGIDWNNDKTTTDIYDQEVNRHFNNLLKKPDQYIKIDTKLVNDARIALQKIDISKLVYQSHRNKLLKTANHYNFDVLKTDDLDQINHSFIRKSKAPWSNGIPGLFTKKGYQNIFLPAQISAAKGLSEDAWVLGDNLSLADTSNAERRLFDHYQQEYIYLWSAFLADISAETITTREQAKAIFLALTTNGGNLLFRLIQEVKNETQFTVEQKEGETESLPKVEIPKAIEQAFSKFTDWDEVSEFQPVSQLFDEIHQAFSQDNTFEKVQNNALKNALDKLDGEADKFPKLLRDIIKSLIMPSESLVVSTLKKKAELQFKLALEKNVSNFCKKKIVNYYPVKKNAKKSITLADFTRFFQSGGILDTFKNEFLNDTDIDKNLIQKVKKRFDQGEIIRQLFFPTGSLKLEYGLNLTSAHPDIVSIELTIGANSKKFTIGAVSKRIFTWPSSNQAIANIEVKDPEGKIVEVQLYNGDEWGVFRLVKNERLILTEYRGTEFKVFTPKPSPFKLVKSKLRGFKCPTL